MKCNCLIGSGATGGAYGGAGRSSPERNPAKKEIPSVDLIIVSQREENIKDAQGKIYKHMKEIIVQKTEKNSLISTLSSQQVRHNYN